ncbi:holo-[acyl-carrier protein] synthase [Mumia flava]|uniref:Holo-[acyl-carrier-protein] synthase n=1 Tax=Mumia flava TaxID=1348852 RepID=A0A0B2BQX9_9ACTN|nr:holo-ACP synthase [Mumia flava]PJJ58204.1 holo-[acyl-carrier protein] synthase [Mumia flava]
MTVLGVGVDLVHVPTFAEQLAVPGTRFERAFTPGERGDARGTPSERARHLAARWAAKEAVVKAWSASLYGSPPVVREDVHAAIEVVKDAWDRPRIVLHAPVRDHLASAALHLSLSHDGDYAVAYVVLSG